MTETSGYLKIDQVKRVFDGGVAALGGVSLDVAPGEIVALLGGSGCGKSTLLRLIAGLDQPSSGVIQLGATTIREPNAAIGLIFQEPRLLPWLTVAQNVAFGLEAFSSPQRERAVDAILERIGLAGYGGRWPRELSGGQAQRIAIARALVANPSILLLDEPFSALDPFTRIDLQDFVLQLWADRRPTLVIVTHDVEEAVVLADRIAIMRPRPGRIVETVPINLPRPRDRDIDAFEQTRRLILRKLDGARRPAAAGEEMVPAAAI